MIQNAEIWQKHIYLAGWRGALKRPTSENTSILLTRPFYARNLMAKDEFKNLGFGEEKPPADTKKEDNKESGKKGELRW